MDAIRQKYVEEVDGGTAEQAREALYKTMDRFTEQSKQGFQKALAKLKEENPPDFNTQKASLLKDLNVKLIKYAINKEKTKRFASYPFFKEGLIDYKKEAEEHVRANWVNYTE